MAGTIAVAALLAYLVIHNQPFEPGRLACNTFFTHNGALKAEYTDSFS